MLHWPLGRLVEQTSLKKFCPTYLASSVLVNRDSGWGFSLQPPVQTGGGQGNCRKFGREVSLSEQGRAPSAQDEEVMFNGKKKFRISDHVSLMPKIRNFVFGFFFPLLF